MSGRAFSEVWLESSTDTGLNCLPTDLKDLVEEECTIVEEGGFR